MVVVVERGGDTYDLFPLLLFFALGEICTHPPFLFPGKKHIVRTKKPYHHGRRRSFSKKHALFLLLYCWEIVMRRRMVTKIAQQAPPPPTHLKEKEKQLFFSSSENSYLGTSVLRRCGVAIIFRLFPSLPWGSRKRRVKKEDEFFMTFFAAFSFSLSPACDKTIRRRRKKKKSCDDFRGGGVLHIHMRERHSTILLPTYYGKKD